MAAAARLLGIAAVGLVALLTAHAGPALGAAERGSIHERRGELRQRVSAMFYHGYDAYMAHGFPRDELAPLSCRGKDTWGPLALTLVDCLDTLYLMGNTTEFAEGLERARMHLNFDQDRNVSAFETNIRVVGGLLSAHFMAQHYAEQTDRPYNDDLLAMAADLATRLLPAFDTPTGIPYGTVNLRHGVPPGETTITSLAGAGTHVLEFITLSRLLTDRPEFERAARGAMRAIWARRSSLNLLGNHIDTRTGIWTLKDAGIGPNADSYFEYLVKAYILTQEREYLDMFHSLYQGINTFNKESNWYMDANMLTGKRSQPWFTALGAFWPGVQVLLGDQAAAAQSMLLFADIWRRYGFVPEAFDLYNDKVHDRLRGYFLRPEMAESIYYLYRATRDPLWLILGEEIVVSLEKATRVPCGHAIVKDVATHELDDRMESFFLSEALKYLYLLFDANNTDLVHQDNAAFVFNTEAHPIPVSTFFRRETTSSKKDGRADEPATATKPTGLRCRRPAFGALVSSNAMMVPPPEPVQRVVPLPEVPQAAHAPAAASNAQANSENSENNCDLSGSAADLLGRIELTDQMQAQLLQDAKHPEKILTLARQWTLALCKNPTKTPTPAAKAAIAGPLDPKQRQARLALFREICYTFQQSYWEIEVCPAHGIHQQHKENGVVAVRHTLGVRQTANPVRDSRTLHDVQTAVDGFNALDSRVTNVTIIYTDGDPCDIPAESRTVPRRIEVQYFCDDNIPTLRTATMKVEENPVCHYNMRLATPLLCTGTNTASNKTG